MKITLVISSLGPGGSERVLSELANYLVTKNHVVTIILLSALKKVSFYSLNPKIILKKVNLKSENSTKIFQRIINFLLRNYYLRKLIADNLPDVVLSFIDITNITTLLAMKGIKIPIIVSERADPNHHKIPKIYSWLRNNFYSDSYRVVVQTKSSLDYFSSKIKKKSIIIPNPNRYLQKFERKISRNPRLIVSTGRLAEQKDYETLIKAMPKVITKYPNLILKIYGKGSLEEKLKELIYSLKLQKNVFLCGVTKNIEKSLTEADLFVLPSIYEGFPNALLEAMSTGLPCIASDCSGNNDIIEHNLNGKLFKVKDINTLSNLILELLGDYKGRKRISVESKKKVLMYDRDNIFSQWNKLLTEASLQTRSK